MENSRISKTRYVATIIVAAFVIIVMSMLNIDVNEAQNYQVITQNSIIMKLETNKLLVNGELKSVDSTNPRTMPYLDENSRTLVPMRCISENLGANVLWDGENRVATIEIGVDTIKFAIDSNFVEKNGTKYEMDTKAIIYEDRTYIPLRALIEVGLNKQVYWENDSKLIIISEDNQYVQENLNDIVIEELTKQLDSLSIVGNAETFEKLLDVSDTGSYYYEVNDAIAPQAIREETADVSKSTDGSDYSKTNTQVKDVDEADIVKNDGRFIYTLSGDKLVVVDTKNPSDIKIVKEIQYANDADKYFSPSEMFLEDNTLVVIGTETTRYNYEYEYDYDYGLVKGSIWRPYFRYTSKTKAICYDVTVPSNMVAKKEIALDGYYVDSRMVNGTVYLVSSQYVYNYYTDEEEKDYRPRYYDSTVSNEELCIDYDRIYYFPEIEEESYTLIAAFNAHDLTNATINTYLGMGENIYMSKNNMYIAHTKYVYDYGDEYYNYSDNTLVYKFKVTSNAIEYIAKRELEGSIINQFAMDEDDNTFRIATSVYRYANRETYRATNVYTLDAKMKVLDKLEGIAEDETIYSVRFVGDRAYLVTFEVIDPLFVIDLSNPEDIKILGELELPGYSTYLHPYDATHIIGFGIETEETLTNIKQKGVKIAMFDVEDPNNPQLMYSYYLGDEALYSNLLYDHKALLFSKEKKLLAFPITIYDKKPGEKYYSYSSDIAIVFNVDLENGFTEVGRISNQENDVDDYMSKYYSAINRIIYIGDNLYTISQNMVKASTMKDLTELSKVIIEMNEADYPIIYYNSMID